jgi:hypothetical protein
VSAYPRHRLASLAVAAFLAACSAPAASTPAATLTHGATPTIGTRPSSAATVRIAQPANGASLAGTSVEVVLQLDGATIVPDTTTSIRPDEGHVHLYLDGVIVSMNYGLEQALPVTSGTHVLRAEFVAADHAPFNPRVESGDVVFTVR